MRRLLGSVAAVAAGTSTAAAFGADWAACAAQPGPFSMWMNEVHFSTNDRTLEVAALAGAQINYAFIDVLTVDADAGITSRRALATDCTRSLDNSLAGGPVIDIFTCRNFAASISAPAAGVVLVNNKGTEVATDDLPIQYLTFGQTPAFLGMAACVLPANQLTHITSEDATSVQLVDPGQYDASIPGVDIYSFNWQGLVPQTYGQLNAGPSEFGAYTQTFVAALLTPLPGGDPAQYGGGPGANNGTCTVANAFGEWSSCSVPCSLPDGSTNATGTQIRYKQFESVTEPFDWSAASVLCGTLPTRSETRDCAVATTCTACQNQVRDGAESDVDCGGGSTNSVLTSPSSSWEAVIAEVRQRVAAGDATAVYDGTSTTCGRCDQGRTCATHGDCASSAGLVCVSGTCAPFAFLNATWFADQNITLTGVAPGVLVGPALDAFRTTVAEVATGGAASVAAADVALAGLLFTPATNSLNLHTRVLADSNDEAVTIGQNLRQNKDKLLFLLAERLRLFAPNVGSGTAADPFVSEQPYGNVLAPAPQPPSSDGLSGGAIAGIVIGSVVALALLAALLAMLLFRRRKQPAQEPARRGSLSVGARAGDDRVASAVTAQPVGAHEKAAFGPTLRAAEPGAAPSAV